MKNTSHLKQLNTKTSMTYSVGNPGLRQACGGVKPVNGIPTLLLFNPSSLIISNDNIYLKQTIKKPPHIHFH
jgi:hypothetical protein